MNLNKIDILKKYQKPDIVLECSERNQKRNWLLKNLHALKNF